MEKNNEQKNIFKFAEEWIAWLITLPFSFIGNFADVVSYIRLFAVGMAGVAIADAFNAMAAMVGKGNMLMIALAAFIALIGNALGVVLGPVSVLVHGVRLNLLELSYFLIREGRSNEAKEIFGKFLGFNVDYDEDILLKSAEMKFKNLKQRISFIDCIGYNLAKKHNARFLTGDEIFRNMENIEFVK